MITIICSFIGCLAALAVYSSFYHYIDKDGGHR
jgi:hypothetical protein